MGAEIPAKSPPVPALTFRYRLRMTTLTPFNVSVEEDPHGTVLRHDTRRLAAGPIE